MDVEESVRSVARFFHSGKVATNKMNQLAMNQFCVNALRCLILAPAHDAKVAVLEVAAWASGGWQLGHPDAMSHTTTGKVLTDKQQGCETGGAEEDRDGKTESNIWCLQVYCVSSCTLKTTHSPPQPAQLAHSIATYKCYQAGYNIQEPTA